MHSWILPCPSSYSFSVSFKGSSSSCLFNDGLSQGFWNLSFSPSTQPSWIISTLLLGFKYSLNADFFQILSSELNVSSLGDIYTSNSKAIYKLTTFPGSHSMEQGMEQDTHLPSKDYRQSRIPPTCTLPSRCLHSSRGMCSKQQPDT